MLTLYDIIIHCRDYFDTKRYRRSSFSIKNELEKTRAKHAKMIKELKKFESKNHKTSNAKSDVDALQLELCAEAKKGAKELQDSTKRLRQRVATRRDNVIELLTELMPIDIDLREDARRPTKKQRSFNEENRAPPAPPPAPPPPPNPVPAVLVSALAPDTVQYFNSFVRVAGIVNEERCSRCEELDDEEVCGDNGKTYRTLCRAVNCAGLALKDIAVGSCVRKVYT